MVGEGFETRLAAVQAIGKSSTAITCGLVSCVLMFS